MKHRLIVASASVLALATALVPGCGDHVATDTDPLTPGAGGSSNAPGGGGAGNQVGSAGAGGAAPGAAGNGSATPGAGGSEGTPPVQLPGAAGTTGASAAASQGGSGGAPGSAGAGGAPPASATTAFCAMGGTAPADGVACTVTCTDPCGIHNLGTRLCTCTNAVFDCATCGFAVEHPLLTPPAMPLAPCELPDGTQEDDDTGCTENERCQSIGRTLGATDGANRFCGCLMNEWDCDSKPASFGG